MSSRRIHLAAISLAFILPAASAQSAASAALAQKLNASFSITETGWGNAGRITNPGAVYVVHTDGLFARAIADHVTPTTTIKDGKPLPTGKGFKGAFGTFGDTLQIKPGERFYLHEVNVKEDAVVLNLISLDSHVVVNGEGGSSRSRLRMYVRFPLSREEQASLSPADVHRLVDPIISPESGPSTVQLGQSAADVRRLLGEPTKIVDLGSKEILMYANLKVTLVNDKVTDAE